MASFGSTDSRNGQNRPAGDVVMPTLLIPQRCHELCSWVVVRSGHGYACLSRLKAKNALCSSKHEPVGGLEVLGGPL